MLECQKYLVADCDVIYNETMIRNVYEILLIKII